MILFGLIAEVLPRLFLGGVIPGLMQAGLFATYIFFVADKVGGKAEPVVGMHQFVKTNLHAFPAYLIPIVVLGGIYGGFVTLTEAAVLGVLCALVAVLFLPQRAAQNIPKMMTEAIDRTSVIILIIMGATLVSAWIIKSGVPQGFATSIIESDLKPWQFLLIMNVCLLVLGMFLEGVAIILIVLPVVFMVVRELGIDMTHFAVVMVINIELSVVTPHRIGSVCDVQRDRASSGRGSKRDNPFFLIMLGLLMLVTFVPALSTWLPNQVLG